MKFSKWHGLGNEYLLLDGRELAEPVDVALVQRLCDPHTGIGSDGVLELTAVDDGRAEVVIWNPDGSTAELSGNGTRIVARWLAREQQLERVEVVVGDRVVRAHARGGLLMEQDMGRVEVGETERIELGSESLEFTPVDVGNPHAVLRHEPSLAEVKRLGPLLERHDRFPARTNVQLVRVDGAHDITVGVWERGAGVTASSGTSACAAAAAGAARGWIQSPIVVTLPGGQLRIVLAENQATLIGPAQEICAGTVASELLTDLGRRAAR